MGEGVKKIITINSTYLFTHQVAVENHWFYGHVHCFCGHVNAHNIFCGKT